MVMPLFVLGKNGFHTAQTLYQGVDGKEAALVFVKDACVVAFVGFLAEVFQRMPAVLCAEQGGQLTGGVFGCSEFFIGQEITAADVFDHALL